MRSLTMMFIVCQLTFMFAGIGQAQSQNKMEDVIYLKNGSVIHGIIIEQVPNKSIKIKTNDGNIFVFEIAQIEKITREPSITAGTYEQESDRPIGNGLMFNPLGFVQFGPLIEGEFTVGPRTVVNPHLRFAGLGLLYHLMSEEGEEKSLAGMAVGMGVKQFLDNPSSPHRFYFAGTAEYGWGSSSNHNAGSNSWDGKHEYMDFMFNFGHRWRFPSMFFINTGIFVGVAKETKDDWWYLTSPSTIRQSALETYIIGMLELSFGWEL